MKPTHTDKSNYLPDGTADTEGQISQLIEGKTLSPETNLRAYRSAAVIGLAISLGATGVLLPRQGDEAIAADPFTVSPATATQGTELNLSSDNPQLTKQPINQSTNQSTAVLELNTQGSKATTEIVEPSSPIVITPIQTTVYHQVQSGDNFWLLAQKYQISAEAIAKANNLDIKATLTVGQSLRIPPTNTIHEMQLGEITEANSPTYGVSKAQLQNTSISSSNTQVSIPTNIQGAASPEPILQARQNDALRNLRGQRDQLRETLGGWRLERNNRANSFNQNNLVTSVPTQLSPTPASGWLNSNQGSRQVSEQSTVAIASTQGSLSSRLSVANNQGTAALTSGTNSLASAANPASSMANVENLSLNNQISTPPTTSSVAPSAPLVITASSSTPAGNANWVNSSSNPNPNSNTTSNWIAHNPEAVSVPSPSAVAPTTVAVMPSSSTLPSIGTQEIAAASLPEVHQVRPGETLDAIARRYGISRQDIARANRINNPNLLFVDQRLTIPVNPNRVMTLLPAGVDNTQKSGSSSDISLVTPPPIVTVAALPQPTPGGIFGGSAISSATTATTTSSTGQLTQDELVTERLRADIRRMREEYQQQQQTPSQPVLVNQNLNQNSASTSSQESRALFPSDSRGLERVNPQFRATTESASTPLPPQPQLVATAPSPAGTYNPMLRLPVGQVVSPDLPPLGAADTYLPNSPARFDGYIWPAEGVLTSGYGMRWGRMHRGIDIAAPTGTPIMAAAPGMVVTAGWNNGGYGNLVEIKHPDGSLTLYAHNNRILVQEGQQVAQGEQISEMGSTGFSTGPHLHFEIHPTGRGAVNPVALMPRE